MNSERTTFYYLWDNYSPEQKRRMPNPRLRGYAQMLLDDINLFAIPHSSSKKLGANGLQLISSSPLDLSTACYALGVNRPSERDLVYHVEEELRHVIVSLLAFGSATYELVKEGDFFRAHREWEFTMVYRRGKLYQRVPAPESPELVPLSKDQVIRQVATNRIARIRKVLKGLSKLEFGEFGKLVLQEMQSEGTHVRIDSSYQQSEYNRALALLTREIGWNCRWSLSITDYYIAIREIRFARTLNTIREEALAAFNNVFKAGCALIESPGIAFSYSAGLSNEELDFLTKELQNGEITVQNALDRLRLYK